MSLALLGVLMLLGAPPQGRSRVELPLPEVRVLPFEVVIEPFPNARARSDEADVRERLRLQAEAWAARALRVNGVARAASASDDKAASGFPRLRGRLSMPASLPRGVIGFDAMVRRGRFMEGKVALESAEGVLIAERRFTLVWGDGQWLKGGRGRRNVPLDQVLLAFARKAVDRGVLGLKRSVAESNAGKGSGQGTHARGGRD